MARKLTEIKTSITDNFISKEVVIQLYKLQEGKTFEDQFSLVSLENILFDVIAYGIFLLEVLFDVENKKADDKLANDKRGRLSWYGKMALSFQYGFDLVKDSDVFDNTGYTLDEINASKIVKNAIAVDGAKPGTIAIKVAGEKDGQLHPVTNEQKESLEAYFQEVKFGGNKIVVINYLPDRLYFDYTIYVDPLVIDSQGYSILNGNKPVEIAITNYLKVFNASGFNGELVLQELTDAIQNVPGVQIAHLNMAETSWLNQQLQDYGPRNQIAIKTIPESGYFIVPTFENISYVV